MQYIKLPDETYQHKIEESGKTIYDPSDTDLWIPTEELEGILNDKLVGFSVRELPLRTRSKIVKEEICKALGYPIPKSFKKTQPRFPGQSFDTYIQKSNNLQIWNEDISASRRYVIIHIDDKDFVDIIKVVTGKTLSTFDTTGTMTQKFQARFVASKTPFELVSKMDTRLIQDILNKTNYKSVKSFSDPSDPPTSNNLLAISDAFDCMKQIVGKKFTDIGRDQERNRGAVLHKLVCSAIGYNTFHDKGQFPDILNQLIEVKLQMSPTIDLGLVLPSSKEPINIPPINGKNIRHCDVRYAIFFAILEKNIVTITHFVLITGEEFFSRFSQFGGKVKNTKIQLRLPSNFFER